MPSNIQQIRDTITTLARYLDKGTFSSLDNVLTSDAVLVLPFPFRSVKGLHAIKEKLRDKNMENEWWDTSSIRSVQVKSPHTALAVSCCGVPNTSQTLWFEDEMVKDKKGWRVKERKVTLQLG